MTREQRWMTSYVDVLTILLIFFLAAAAGTARKLPLHPPDPTPVQKPSALDQVQQSLSSEEVRTVRTSRGLSITLPQEVLFAPGNDAIRPQAVPTLETIARALAPVPNRIVLSGHADPTPIHNVRFRGNWDLAAARSVRLLEVLTASLGLEESRFSVESHGASKPRTSNDTAEGRALNRRVEILVLP